jgi:DNA polymerase I-like protein with 3'-5' exonuclease and polymerase domains
MAGRISRKEIERAYVRYFKRYRGIKRFMDRQQRFAEEHHYVETLFGMRQHLDVSTQNNFKGDYEAGGGMNWRSMSVNHPVQGTAHQLLECGLVNLRRQPNKYKVLGVPVMDVHDALYCNVRILDLVEAAAKIKYLLEKESLNTVKKDFPDIDWKVPITTEAEAGLRLGCKVDLKDGFTVESFLADWFLKCRKQVLELNKEMRSIQS